MKHHHDLSPPLAWAMAIWAIMVLGLVATITESAPASKIGGTYDRSLSVDCIQHD